MLPSSTDLPSVIRIPSDTEELLSVVRDKIEEGVSVLILDLRQGSLVTYSGELPEEEVTSDSLPFLLSNHSVKVLNSSSTLGECLETLLGIEGTVCVFHNPSDAVICDLPTHTTRIINENALLGLVQQQDKRFLTSITVGES